MERFKALLSEAEGNFANAAADPGERDNGDDTFFGGGAARGEGEEEEARSRPGGDVMERCA